MPALVPFLWLALGALLQIFNGGRWTIAAAAWLAPVFLLHFSRRQKPVRGMIWLGFALLATIYISYRGLIPAPALATAAICALIALAALIPYLADRLLFPRLPGFLSTIVFPLTWAVADFAAARLSPYGTWGSAAYTQYGNLPLMQWASVTGTPGIAFLIAWFASVLNWAWDRKFEWRKVRTGLVVYAAVWSLAMMLGGARLVFSPAPQTSVRTATIAWPEGIMGQPEFLRALEPNLSNDERDELSTAFARIHDRFVEATRIEARAGAQIVVWPEATAMVFDKDEPALLGRARDVAREENVYLLIGVGTVFPDTERPFENKAVLIDPAGALVLSYAKAIPVPGFEAGISRCGKPVIQTQNSPFGKIAAAICFDLDFPSFIRQVGTANADLLLVPASDWEAIKLAHHVSATFRAIENGVTLVRATRWGLSAAVDPYGRLLGQLDAFSAPNQNMVAQVPVSGARTIYARFGDWFAWLCVAGFLALLVWRPGGVTNGEYLSG
ncbi:MAG: apolipoprotein N-acyltransferase [Burkholderiales bacterium]